MNTLSHLCVMKGGKNTICSYFLGILIGTFLLAGITHGETLPSALISMDCQEESYAILVEKHTQKLFLYGCAQEGVVKLIKSFPCSTGENSGDKKKRGDKRTPEGIYFFNQVFEDEHLEPRYGVKAFALDYPNSLDRLQKKGGRGIWLHGTNKTLAPNDSRGCIALNNKDILELSNYISLYRTPIIVLKKIEYLSKDEVKKRGERLGNFTEKWLESWNDRDLTSYMSCYDKDFRSKGMNWTKWRNYKDRLNKKYRKIDVTIELVQGFQHDNYSLVAFRQNYDSDSFKSKGIKRLYLSEIVKNSRS